MEREREPGTLCLYNTADTQALGMLLVKAAGLRPTRARSGHKPKLAVGPQPAWGSLFA
jgi:hypothetical protein